MEDEIYDTFWVWDKHEGVCELTPDWKTDNMEDGAWGFFVSDPYGLCKYIESEGWEYSSITTD
jgi:hypothetical protein